MVNTGFILKYINDEICKSLVGTVIVPLFYAT